MPKIIPGLREQLIAEARRQLETGGYSAMTIRSVARACKVAVGTVYNYFTDKEEFVASVLLVHWTTCIETIAKTAAEAQEAETLLRCMYDQLCGFMDCYRILFQDEAAIAVFTASVGRYHDVLRSQLAQMLRKFCQSDFEAEFVTEALLTWTVAGEGFEEIYRVIQKICK